MKLAALILSVGSLLGSDLYSHVQTFPVDAYLASWTNTPPAVPGERTPESGISISLSTTDELTQAFIVYARVRLGDGTECPFKAVLQRSMNGPTVVRFSTGNQRAVKVVHFWVIRLHAEPEDLLLMDLS